MERKEKREGGGGMRGAKGRGGGKIKAAVDVRGIIIQGCPAPRVSGDGEPLVCCRCARADAFWVGTQSGTRKWTRGGEDRI